jgi:EAL domain-containing protein (putative c-di-GMP-specific phosphodiesterase class I)
LLQLDRWLINQILKVYADAVAAKRLTLAVPLSLTTLGDKTLVSEIITVLSQSPAHTSSTPLIISLDGTHFIEQYAAIELSLKQLRQLGCKIILDQFGDNFTSFKQLPYGIIDYVRLPNRFIQTLHSNPLDEMMVTIINGHIHRLNARSVAGPADLPALLNKLSHLEIDLAEGGSISHAIPLAGLLDNDLLRTY